MRQGLLGAVTTTAPAMASGRGHVYMAMLGFSTFPMRSSRVSAGFERLSKHNVTPWVGLFVLVT